MTWIALRPWVVYTGGVLALAAGFGAVFLGSTLIWNAPIDSRTAAIIVLVSWLIVWGGSVWYLGRVLQKRRDIFAGYDRRHFVSSNECSFKLLFNPATGMRQWVESDADMASSVQAFLSRVDLADEDEIALDAEESFASIVTRIGAKVSILEMVDGFTASFARTEESASFLVAERRLMAKELRRVMEEHDDVFRRAYEVEEMLLRGDV